MTRSLYPGDIVEVPALEPGLVYRARILDAFGPHVTAELLDGGDPDDPKDPGPYKGDEVIVSRSDVVVIGPAQGRGVTQ